MPSSCQKLTNNNPVDEKTPYPISNHCNHYKINYFYTSYGTAQTANNGIYIEKEYPYIQNVEMNVVSDPKHFISIVNKTGNRKPIP